MGCGKLDFKNGFLDILRNPTEASAPKFEAEPGWPCCTCCQILIQILQQKLYYQFQSFSDKIYIFFVDRFVKGVHSCLEGVHKSLFAYWYLGVVWSPLAVHPVMCQLLGIHELCFFTIRVFTLFAKSGVTRFEKCTQIQFV